MSVLKNSDLAIYAAELERRVQKQVTEKEGSLSQTASGQMGEKSNGFMQKLLSARGALCTLLGLGTAGTVGYVVHNNANVASAVQPSEAGEKGSEFTLGSLFETEEDRISEAKQKAEDSERLYMLETSEKLSRMALYIRQVEGVLEEYDYAMAVENGADESARHVAYSNLKKSVMDAFSTVTDAAVPQKGREDHASLPYREEQCRLAIEVLKNAATRLQGQDAVEVEEFLGDTPGYFFERIIRLSKLAEKIPVDRAEACRNELKAAIAVIDQDRETQSSQSIWETGHDDSDSPERTMLVNPSFPKSVKPASDDRTAQLLP